MFYGIATGAIALGFILDIVLSDAESAFRPSSWIIRLIDYLDERQNHGSDDRRVKSGAACAALVILIPVASALVLSVAVYKLHPALYFLLAAAFVYFLLSGREVRDASMDVYDALLRRNIMQARQSLSYLTEADSDEFGEQEIVLRTVECQAVRTTEQLSAPLFYMMIGGPVLGWCCRTVVLLSERIGITNERYQFFGRAARRLMDIAMYLPSRVTSLFMVAASFLMRLNASGARRILIRDGGQGTEADGMRCIAAMAGALSLRLGGPVFFEGVRKERPQAGDEERPPKIQDIRTANRLMLVTSVLMLAAALLVRILIGVIAHAVIN